MTDRRSTAPKTVIRRLPRSPAGADAGELGRLARPLLDLADRVERDPSPDPRALAAAAAERVIAFEREARRAGIPDAAVLDARDAALVVLRARGRNNPALSTRDFEAAMHRALPVGRIADARWLRRRASDIARAGPSRGDPAAFLERCLEALDAAETGGARIRRRRGFPVAASAVALFCLVVAGWGAAAEWRYRGTLLAGRPDADAIVAAALASPPAVRAGHLDALAEAADRIGREAARSPLGLVARIEALDPGAVARRDYARAAAALAAGPVEEALSLALATEGDPAALYDALRAASILRGEADWRPEYLEGWVRERAGDSPGLDALAPHVGALEGPPPGLPPPDPEVLGQARGIAAEGSASDRAFIELMRSAGAAALPRWTLPEAVPALAEVLVRRSGRPIGEGVPGLFTEAGWAYASGPGLDDAVALADRESARLLGRSDQPDRDAVLDALQARTLRAWSAHLADLRVRPFSDQPSAVLVSGVLAARNSPLTALILEVWRQAGGHDRRRSHANQLRIATEFGPAVQFVEQGRMAEISRIFAALNVSLAALGRDTEVGSRTLLDVRGRAASVIALQQAPLVVVQIVEDVLAQSAVPDAAQAPSEAGWRQEIAALCGPVMDGLYPFADGPDADLARLSLVFGPDGPVRSYFDRSLAELMDTSQPEWRWKPEARLSGLDPDSARFFQRVTVIGDALFGAGAPDVAVTLEALAQRGSATISIGGAPAPVVVDGDPVDLRWPGPDPALGFQVAFDTGGEVARQGEEGPFGLLRALDRVRLRPRDDGRRFLVDLRLGDARLYFQMAFADAVNPVSVRPLMNGLRCPGPT